MSTRDEVRSKEGKTRLGMVFNGVRVYENKVLSIWTALLIRVGAARNIGNSSRPGFEAAGTVA
jgi:hypothetical protein